MKTEKLHLLVEDAGRSTTISLQKPVSRLGRADYCEVRLNTRSSHAATVIVKSDHVSVINRSPLPIDCGQVSIPSGERQIWRTGQALALEGVLVTLVGARRTASALMPTHAVVTEVTQLNEPGEVDPQLPRTGESDATNTARHGRRQIGILVLCGIALVTMLTAAPVVSRSAHQKKAMDDCLSQLQAEIDATERHALIHSRWSSLVSLINSSDPAADRTQRPVVRDTDILAFCRSLAEADNPHVTDEERDLATQFIRLLSRGAENSSSEQIRTLERCLKQTSVLLKKYERAAGVHSRMTALAETIYRSQGTASVKNKAMSEPHRDAINFCRSLAQAGINDVSDFERQLAKSLAALLEEGV